MKIARKWFDEVSDAEDAWPTFIKGVNTNGRLIGVGVGRNGADGPTWMYRAVPMVAMDDARDATDIERGIELLETAFVGLSARADSYPGGRKTSITSYREYHLLAINIPRPFRPPSDHPLAEQLTIDFADMDIPTRVCLFGVRLIPAKPLRGTWKDKAKQIVDMTMGAFSVGDDIPQSDYDTDAETISGILDRAGLMLPTAEQLLIADSFLAGGGGQTPIIYPHADHSHVFRFAGQARRAHQIDEDNNDRDGRDCSDWDDMFGADQWGLTAAAVTGTKFHGVPSTGGPARWVSNLLRSDAVAVSIRGLVEPAAVTMAEAKRNRDKMRSDLEELRQKGKEALGSMEDREADQAWFFDAYERADTGEVPPTSTSTSAIVLLESTDPKAAENLSRSLSVDLGSMDDMQYGGIIETLLCSPVRRNPIKLDWMSTVISASGGNDLSVAGDHPTRAVMIGFTERDRQPVYINPHEATAIQDKPPIIIVIGEPGSGKTQLMLRICQQFGSQLIPVRGPAELFGDALVKATALFVNPKAQQVGHVATRYGGNRLLLDDWIESDGVFDSLRFFQDPQLGFEQTLANCVAIYPGTHEAQRNAELPIQRALHYGVSQGATATGQALEVWTQYAKRLYETQGASMLPEQAEALRIDVLTVEKLLDMAKTNPRAKAMIGSGASTTAMAIPDGFTVLEATGGLSIPASIPEDISSLSANDRISLAVLRTIVFAAMHALANTGAVLALDEGWVFMIGAGGEMERMGKLSRSLNVPVLLADQDLSRVKDLSMYISQAFIFHMRGDINNNAREAFRMFGIDPDYGARSERVVVDPELPGYSNMDGTASTRFNTKSLKPLVHRDLATGKVVSIERGAVAYYIDLHGHCVPVEIKLPSSFLEVSSTNPLDAQERAQH